MQLLNINNSRCQEVVEKLNKHFFNKAGLADVEFPRNVSYGTNEYYLYMFYSCLLDYGMRSKIYHRNLIDTYIKYPEIFYPKYVEKMPEEDLYNIIVSNIHPRYPKVATQKWLRLSKQLLKYDNITTYLKNIKSFEELNKFIKDIKGYGQKTGGLLIRIICDSKICNFKENINSIPIDRHDIEISYLTNIIDTSKVSSNEIKELSSAYVNIGKKLNVNPSDIDKYLWQIGNSYCNKKRCYECPLNNLCRRVQNNKLHFMGDDLK